MRTLTPVRRLLDLSEPFREDGPVTVDNPDWRRLGDYVTRRREELNLTQAEVHAAGGPSTATQRIIEGATQTSYRGQILARLERALQWAPGSVERILGGGEPTPTRGQRKPGTTMPADFDAMADWLRSIADNPNRAAPLRAWAEAQIDQIAAIRNADHAEAEARGELAS